MSSSDDSAGCWGVLVFLSLIYGVFYEMHTWVINTEAVAKRNIYYSQTIRDTGKWLDESDSFVSSFQEKRNNKSLLNLHHKFAR